MTKRMSILGTIPAMAAVVASSLAWTADTQAAAPVFSKTITSLITPTGAAPLSLRAGAVAMADFNGDGLIDAAVPGGVIAGVAVLLNDGVGGASLAWYDTGRTPVALAAADFDGNGSIDLAVVLRGQGGVTVLVNDGTGQFVSGQFSATGVGATAAAVVDVNQDGMPDLVVANRGDGTVSVLINIGGAFSPPQAIALPATLPAGVPQVSSQPNALATADLNNDGMPDVAVACAGDDSVKVLFNVNHVLTLGATYPAGPCPVAVAAADLNGDGRMDLVAADFEGPQVTTLTQDVTGQFASQDVFLVTLPYESFAGGSDLLAMDLNADWSPDIQCAGYTLYNDGTGQFGTGQYLASTNGFFGTARQPDYRGTFVARAGAGTIALSYVQAAWLYGDVNGDSVVNVGDLQQLVMAWGGTRTPLSGNWNMNADFNEDGYVNVGDLQLMVAHWGQSH